MLSYRRNITPPPVIERVEEEEEEQTPVVPDLKRLRDYIIIKPLPGNPFADRGVMIREVTRSVAAEFGVSSSEIMGPSRARRVLHPRAVVRKLLVEAGLSAAEVGRRMCASDHSSVLHALKMFPIYAKVNPLVQQVYDSHKELLEAAEKRRVRYVTGDY